MKYFIDTEFLEGTQKERFPISFFRKQTKPTIDLISIGIVTEDGRELYEISKDFNLHEAWNRFQLKKCCSVPGLCGQLIMGNCSGEIKEYWIRKNVLYPIWKQLFLYQECDYAFLNSRESDKFKKELDEDNYKHLFTYKSLKGLIYKHGKTNKEISKLVKGFVFQTDLDNQLKHVPLHKEIEFYAYFADYDWVAFGWLFGKMKDLPKGFPMYCKDLKQTFDKLNTYSSGRKVELQNHSEYPKQENEHNAIADARWNKKLFDFLNKI